MTSPRGPIALAVGLLAIVLVLIRPPLRLASKSVDSGSERTSGIRASDTIPRPRPATGAPRDPALGLFFYLFDVSGSIRVGSDQLFRRSDSLIVPAIQALAGLDEVLPQQHRVGTIGAASLRQQPLCDLYIAKPTLFTKKDSADVARRERDCLSALIAAPSEPFTDISGAFAYGALSIRGSRPALRGIVLVSDMDEDTPPGNVPATPDLHGICVAVFSMVSDAISRRPALLAERESLWKSRLRSWGAKDSFFQTTLGFDAQELASFFRGCEHK